MRRLATYTLLLAASGCAAGVAEFRPTERAWGASRQGEEQAIYELRGEQGRAGEAKVWAGGIRKERGELVADVAIELKNTGDLPLAIDVSTLRLSGVVAGEDVIDDVVPLKTAGSAEVAPRSVGGLRVLFQLPSDLAPRDITEFRLEWTVRIGGDVYAQFTPFVRDQVAEGGYYAYSPAYDPAFWGPGFTWGLGLGWGMGWGYGWPGYYPYWGTRGHPHHHPPPVTNDRPPSRDAPGITPLRQPSRPLTPRGADGGPSPARLVPSINPPLTPSTPRLAPATPRLAPASPGTRPTTPSAPPPSAAAGVRAAAPAQSAPPRATPHAAPAPRSESRSERGDGKTHPR